MELFNIGIGEILLIFVIALLVFGPERLPDVARQAARIWVRLRQVSDEVQRTFVEESRSLREPFEEAGREVRSLSQPFEETRQEVAGAAQSMRQASSEVRSTLNVSRGAKAVPSNGQRAATLAPDIAAVSADPAPLVEERPYKPVSQVEETNGRDP